MLYVQRLSPQAAVPRRQSDGAAGYDLCCIQDFEILPGQRKCVTTGLSLIIPTGHYGRVAPRSGLAANYGLQVGAGVIDSDYRGELKILLFNCGHEPAKFAAGSRIAQLILEKISTPDVEEVLELASTIRGSGGFGSTGLS